MPSLPIPVNWITRDVTNTPFRLFDIKLETLKCYGVYVIYEPGGGILPPMVLKVGQGNVADRLGAHRQLDVLRQRRVCLAMWAAVSPLIVNNVERYLADRYQPLYGDAFPDVTPVAVTPLPFAA